MPKSKALKKSKQEPLYNQLQRDAESVYVKSKPSAKNHEKQKHNQRATATATATRATQSEGGDGDGDGEGDGGEETRVPENLSRKIFELSRSQLEEEDQEDKEDKKDKKDKLASRRSSEKFTAGANSNTDLDSDEDEDQAEGQDDDEEEDGDEEDEDETAYKSRDPMSEMEISEEDERVLAQFMNSNSSSSKSANSKAKSRTLGDIIMEKLHEKNSNNQSLNRGEQAFADAMGAGLNRAGDMMETDEDHDDRQSVSVYAKQQLNPQLVEVYKSVGALMKRYRSGKVPKALKIIPIMRNWEEVVYLTRPEEWSPQAMFAATRIFASNLNPQMAQRFYNVILLPAVRQDIQDSENKKLNYHYYMSLKKALYKPAAFFKGILLPLVEEECTLREAVIVGSVLAKVSIPMMHSAAAMMRLAQTKRYSGVTSLFLRVLLNKKYSLPYKVIDAMVNHFLKFHNEKRELPVLWHQCLLVFAERYKLVLTDEQREALRKLLKHNKNLQHYKITPEIRRELFSNASQNQSRS